MINDFKEWAALAALGWCLAAAPQAGAIPSPLAIGDADYLGLIHDGIPSNPANEAGYINDLITLAAGAGNTTIGTETHNRLSSTVAGPFPTAVTGGSVKEEDGTTPGFDNVIDATGFAYVLGKYDASQAGSLVWYVGGVAGQVALPTHLNNRGLSHISLYNPGSGDTPPVPETGASLVLLGLGLLGIGGVRRVVVQQ